jgi:putative ABC transport system permease protein
VTLPGAHALPVVGVYSDYGNPRGQAMVGIGTFVAWYPDAARLQHAVRTDDAAGIIAGLEAMFALGPEQVRDQAAVKALSLSVFERTFAVTGALNALTLGVAGLALVASLVSLSGMRLVQVAPLWAVGVTRGWLMRVEAVRVVLLSALVAVVAVPVGLALAWVLLAVVNVEAFGWRLPMRLYPSEWLRMGALALVVAGLAAVVPVRRLARAGPSEMLRVFAQER